MTPSEWALKQDGHSAHEKRQDRRIARWLSPLLSATAGSVITPAQLLGEEEAENPAKVEAVRIRKAEREIKAMQRKIAARHKKGLY